ncbi:protein O-mannosyl-transferase [Aureococcus anophagefferens]|uniref:Protein O-mannosyl-transferase n=1 Tax=Aureococcus anophagefferens TaxID=44056 RepID=A0ABR1GG24_AURAN
MSWGGKRTKENSSIAGSGGTTCDAQAFEWEVEHASIFVRLEAWERSRVVSHRKRGDKVWGSKERGGVVELATPFDGFVNLGEPPGCMRMTGNKKPLVEIRQRERTRAKGWGTPLGFKVTKEERRVMLGETWRAAYHGGPVVVREAPSRASRPLGTVKFNEAVKVSRKPDASALAAAPSTEKWVQVLGPVPGWMLTEDSSLGTLLRRDPVPDFPVELAVPRPRDRRKEGLRPRAAPPVAGACSATSRDDSEGWSDADSVASLDTTASNCTITPKEDLDLAPVCWISARSSCTPSDVRKLICLELPVAPEAVQIELELLGRKLLAPEAMTLWEMGLLGSDKVLWSLNCAGTADDDDDEATGAADPIAAAFARKYTVQPKHPIGTGALGPPLRIRGDASIKRVIEQLCEANPGLRDEGVVPVGAGKESDMPNVSSLGRVPVRFDAAVADAQAKRLVEERLAEEENEWTPWVYDAATGKRRRKKKRKKKKEQLEQEAYDRIGKGFSGETTYARETVLEDETTAWSAGLRDGGVFAFIYIGDIQHDLGVDQEDELEQALEEMLQEEKRQDDEADAHAEQWAEKLGLVEKMAEVQAKLSDAEIWADAQRARAAYCDASRAAAERAVASAKRLLAKDNAAKRIAEGERKKAKEERDAAKRELETYEEQEEPRSAFDEFAQFWATQQGDAGNAGEHEKDWATRMAEKGQVVSLEAPARGPTMDPSQVKKDKDVDLSKSYCEDFMAWWRENRADDAGKRGNLTAKQRTKMELRERQSASEELKSRGDDRYKKGDFEQCVIEYTRCIAMCSRPDGHFALKVRNNRAAAYKQLGNHAAVAEDCTLVLRAWPENVKALLRRAEALEACEDYEGALEDVEAVLKIRATTRGEHEVGDKNAAKCVQDRSRLKRSVYELEHDETGEGKRRLAARRRKAEAAKSGASRIETSAQAAIRAKAEQDAAAFAVDFEDTRCVVRGCGAPRNQPTKNRRFMWADPYHEKQFEPVFEHKATLIWLAGPDMELDDLREHAEIFDDEWGARYLKPNGHHNWDCPPTEEEIAAMLKIPFWKRRRPLAARRVHGPLREGRGDAAGPAAAGPGRRGLRLAGSYGGGGGGGGGYANADKMDYVKKDKNGNVRKHSKRCMCDKCQAEKKAKQDKVDKEARKAAREAKAQKNAVIRAKNQLTVMVRNAVIACKAAKAAAVDAAEAAENRAEQAPPRRQVPRGLRGALVLLPRPRPRRRLRDERSHAARGTGVDGGRARPAMASGRGRGNTLPAWMTSGANAAAPDAIAAMLGDAASSAAARERQQPWDGGAADRAGAASARPAAATTALPAVGRPVRPAPPAVGRPAAAPRRRAPSGGGDYGRASTGAATTPAGGGLRRRPGRLRRWPGRIRRRRQRRLQ